ncbi:MAG: hypothetical protein NTV34_00865, partial [Proteobacteria bacterium]|nr:hypothetical protein [Pseudomonadota bacterium]
MAKSNSKSNTKSKSSALKPIAKLLKNIVSKASSKSDASSAKKGIAKAPVTLAATKKPAPKKIIVKKDAKKPEPVKVAPAKKPAPVAPAKPVAKPPQKTILKQAPANKVAAKTAPAKEQPSQKPAKVAAPEVDPNAHRAKHTKSAAEFAEAAAASFEAAEMSDSRTPGRRGRPPKNPLMDAPGVAGQKSGGLELHKIIDGLIKQFKKAGTVAFKDIESAFPKGAINPDLLDDVIVSLQDRGIEVSDRRSGAAGRKGASGDEEVLGGIEEDADIAGDPEAGDTDGEEAAEAPAEFDAS